MSASLVGSEMCIRDRQHHLQHFSSCGHDTIAADAINSSTPATSSSTSAVSYTHLTLPTICSV
eukprot:6134766-Alexandrium_andersonii.AAC.1